MPKKKKERVALQASSFNIGAGDLFSGVVLPDHLAGAEETHERSGHSQDTQRPTKPRPLLAPLGPKRVLKISTSAKGRGGKKVTLLKTLPSSHVEERKALAQAIGKALGCRAWVEEELICLQGEQSERLTVWVERQPR